MSGPNRRMVLGGLLASLGVGTRAWAEGPAELPLLTGRMRVPPDFARLHAQPHLVGVRPHRVGGVRLELDPVGLEGPGGVRRVVHNYGHGAAGITLAFGCAAAASGLVEKALASLGPDDTRGVAVVGAGIVGLTTAAELKRRHPELPVTVYAAETDVTKTTSWVAGGQFEPSGVWREYLKQGRLDELYALLTDSDARIRELVRSDVGGEPYGIARRDNFTLDQDQPAVQDHTPDGIIADPVVGKLPFPGLSGVGRHYTTWLVNPTILLPQLVRELTAQGVGFVQRRFGSMAELAQLPEAVIVNAVGYGAKSLWGDEGMVAFRGHLVRLERHDPALDWFFGGGCENGVSAYIFCRQHDVVVGGTYVYQDERTSIEAEDAPVFEQVLANGKKVFAGDVGACRRPVTQ